jgi:hypothetical protein
MQRLATKRKRFLHKKLFFLPHFAILKTRNCYLLSADRAKIYASQDAGVNTNSAKPLVFID